MYTSNDDQRLSRFLSLLLRHQPEAAGIRLDEHGWAEVDALLAGISATGRQIDMSILERIVREDEKHRYSFSENRCRIRANQDHSLNVDIQLQRTDPPSRLYHGTASRFLESIRKQGLVK